MQKARKLRVEMANCAPLDRGCGIGCSLRCRCWSQPGRAGSVENARYPSGNPAFSHALIDALALRQIGRIIARRAGAKATNGEAWIARKHGFCRGPRFIDPGEICQGASVVQRGAPATAAAPSLLAKTRFVGATTPVTSYHVPEFTRVGARTPARPQSCSRRLPSGPRPNSASR